MAEGVVLVAICFGVLFAAGALMMAALQVDSLNALENTGAVKAEEIARGVGLAGLAAKQAGMEIETLNAIIAKTIEVTP